MKEQAIGRVALFIIFLFTTVLGADEIQMKNGDRITGQVINAGATTITLQTDYAGQITVQVALVAQVVAGAPPAAATTAPAPQQQVANTTSAVVVPAAPVAPPGPSWLRGWTGYVETNINLTNGNSSTTNLGLGANATRLTPKNTTILQMAYLYAKDSTPDPDRTTANAVRGGPRYEHNLSDRFTTFTFMTFEHDPFQNLDLRWVMGGGLGYFLTKTEKMQFQLYSGGSLNKEDFVQLSRQSGELILGQKFSRQIANRVTINQQLEIFPNLNDAGEYRANFDSTMLLMLTKYLGWQLTISDRYLSNPVSSLRKNDVLVTSGIRVTFAH
jgi:putative salt-induced outer membrane protein YdiY